MPVPNPAAAAVDVHNAVDFAAALHTLVQRWNWKYKNIITVDAEAGCVSYQQGDTLCIIFSCNTPPVQFVKVEGLPRSFIGAEQAQQVRRDAREMKPDQKKNVQPLAAPHLKPQTCLTAFAVKRRSTAASISPHPFCSSVTSCVLC